MDILQKYKQEHPVSVLRPIQRQQSEYGFFIRLAMKMSGGRIDNARQAIRVLLIAAVVISAASIVIFIRAFGGGSQAQNLFLNVDQRQFVVPKP